MICPKCKKDCPDGSIVCPYCLRKLGKRKWLPVVIIILCLLTAAAVASFFFFFM